MRLADAITIYAGGPGSGCTGPNCGRKGSPIKFELKDGKYIWSGGVTSGNTTVDVRKNKYSELAKDVAKYVGDRLFSDGPIKVNIIWDNQIGSAHGALGVASTNSDGTHAQVYLASKRFKGNQDLPALIAHELTHVWQSRHGWKWAEDSVPYEKREEEIHARRVGELLGNEFTEKHAKKYGLDVPAWLNTPKYFSFADKL